MKTAETNNSLNFRKMNSGRRLILTALFTAAASSIYILESFIPKPLPFMKIGLANVIPLILILTRNYREAFLVMFAKILLGGFITGTLFSPTTILSFSGSVISFSIMVFLFIIPINFSIIGISLAGAVSHNFGQLLMVRLLLIKESEIFYLTPLLIILGMITGAITGYIAYLLLNKLNWQENNEVLHL
ncbi:MAG: Gx transporter family protein [Candidatus Cloacimonetes bacterium]|nr:Gx transporter family protein [Candidatus Cloacimonadota bacterium]